MCFLILLMFCLATVSDARNSVTPLNDAVLKGSLVRLKCSSNNKSRWIFSTSTSINSKPEPICNVPRCMNANYSLETTNNITSFLIINTSSSSYSFAGTYSCESHLDKGSAELVVLESSANDSITQLNTAVLKGSLVRLQCSVGVNWRWTFSTSTSNTSTPEPICDMRRRCVNTNYSLETTNNITSSLIIDTSLSSYSFAGTYSCGSPRGKGSAELIVLENDPKCDFNATYDSSEDLEPKGTKLMAWCNISFRGRWAPVVEWRLGDVNGPMVQTGIINITIADQSVTSTLTVFLKGSIGSFQYSVTTKFVESMRPDSTTATNIPDYNYTWICCRGYETREIVRLTARTVTSSEMFEPITGYHPETTEAQKKLLSTHIIVEIILVSIIVALVGYIVYSKIKAMKSANQGSRGENALRDHLRMPESTESDGARQYVELCNRPRESRAANYSNLIIGDPLYQNEQLVPAEQSQQTSYEEIRVNPTVVAPP